MKAQRLIQMRLIEDVPNSHYDLAVSLQLVGKRARDLSQGECGKAVTARSNAARTDGKWNSLAVRPWWRHRLWSVDFAPQCRWGSSSQMLRSIKALLRFTHEGKAARRVQKINDCHLGSENQAREPRLRCQPASLFSLHAPGLGSRPSQK
jgi:hypothetical protein